MDYIEILEKISEEMKLYDDYISRSLIGLSNDLMEVSKKSNDVTRERIAQELKRLIRPEKTMQVIWIYSVLMSVHHNKDEHKEIVEYIRTCPKLNLVSKFYLYWQISGKIFTAQDLSDGELQASMIAFWYELVNQYIDQMKPPLHKINSNERNQNLVVVVCPQILGVQHAPTKIAMDKCICLMKKMGKEVFLINSAEILPIHGEVPFFGEVYGNYIEAFKTCEKLEYDGGSIPFFQCDQNMPDLKTLELLVQTMYQLKPYMIVGIGKSLLLDIFSKITTTLLVPMNAEITESLCDYQICYQEQIKKEECAFKGIDPNRMIYSKLGFKFKEEAKTTRKEWGLPEDKFIMVTVGNRLSAEISGEYCDMLESIMKENTFMVFIGAFPEYEDVIKKYPRLRENSKNISFASNLLSLIDNCDLYVNMKRQGGGTSAVMAIYQGVPVVTQRYGDIAVNVGNDFVVEDDEHMADIITKYTEDGDFYNIQSQKARARGREMVNNDEGFINAVKLIETKEGWE